MTALPFSDFLTKLYDCTLEEEKKTFCIHDNRLSKAARIVTEAYENSGKFRWRNLLSPESMRCNYQDPAFRWVYLHKYAGCHTDIVCKILLHAGQAGLLNDLWNRNNCNINMCSLGGGPGIDVVAFLTFLELVKGDLANSLKVSVVDCHPNWGIMFRSILKVLMTGKFGCLAERVSHMNFESRYVAANLLMPFNSSTHLAIASADFVTMVMFVSATGCYLTCDMIKRIFTALKPGAIVLFIDSVAGDFGEAVRSIANNSNLHTIYGPTHPTVQSSGHKVERYGIENLREMKCVVHIMKKMGLDKSIDKCSKTLSPFNQTIEVRYTSS